MKKIISIILAVVLAAVALPLSAVAADEKVYITDYAVGETLQFGSYPQEKVTNTQIYAELEEIDKNWISYNYYISGKQSDYMKYADVVFNGEKYRAVTFSSYRPYQTINSSSESASCQYDNNYLTGKVYYFKWKPLTWKVLDPQKGLVMCSSIIDSQEYYPSESNRTIDEKTIYPNNYEYSTIRTWLNNCFINAAFSQAEQEKIETTRLLNPAYSVDYSQYNSRVTNDKIYLLSFEDVKNASYGFSNYASRHLSGTDYAKAQGLSASSKSTISDWLLRTARNSIRSVCYVDYYDNLSSGVSVANTYNGIVPAFNFNPSSKIFEPEEACSHPTTEKKNAVEATCLFSGFSGDVVCTVCGEVIEKGERIEALGHNMVQSEAKEPTCTEQGNTAGAFCTRCDYAEGGEIIPAKGHTADVEVIENKVDPTCTAKGSYDVVTYCKECKAELSRKTIEADKAEHDCEIDYVAPTCTTAGKISLTCKTCKKTTEKTIEALGHNYVAFTFEPTCTQEGYTKHYCVNCGDEYIDAKVKALGHSMRTETIKPTCTENGCDIEICNTCGYNYSNNVVKAAGHKAVIDKAVAATCTHIGLTEGKHCSVCGDVLVAQKETEKLEHTFNAVVTAPTCTEKGYTTYTCECGESYVDDYVDATGHTDKNNDGKCDSCGASIEGFNPSANCSCKCHKSGFAGFIWKIMRIFYKIFKTHKTCACGVAHY